MSNGARVLVVTQDAEVGARMCGELRSVCSEAVLATQARTAVRIAAELQPALVISEHELPDMDGDTLLCALRALPGLDGVPAIALNAAEETAAGGPFNLTVTEATDPRSVSELAGALLAGESSAWRTGRHPVLLVDGDRVRRGLTERRLREAGFDARTATSGPDGLRLAEQLQFDAVVSDVVMPGMDGYELTVELRSAERTKALPIILTCSPVDPVDLELVNALGASALVFRSPEMSELVDALRNCLAEPAALDPAAPVFSHEPTADDPIDHQLHELIREGEGQRERIASQTVELAFLAGFGIGISSAADAERLLDEVLARCAEVTGFRCGAAYLTLGTGQAALQGQVGFPDSLPLADFFGDPGLLDEAIRAAQGGIAHIPSDHVDWRRARLVLHRAGLASLLVAPVRDDAAQLGVLVLGSPRTATTPRDERMIATIAAQVGRWLSRVGTLSALSRSQRRTVERLARAAEFRDEETANHTQRVSRYCTLLATLTGLDERRSELVGAASMMHDIGKLGIPDSILRKAGALDRDERRHMRRHADYGRKILAGESDPLLDLAAVIAWTHHERWDGRGYPRRMRGEEIPLEGRIVAIGDVFDAITSDRVYRPAMTLEDALGLMRAGRGTHFDPDLLDLFMDALPQVLDIRRRHPDRARPRSESEPVIYVY